METKLRIYLAKAKAHERNKTFNFLTTFLMGKALKKF